MAELFYRDIMEYIEKQMDTRDILILLGSRQAGKTTILKMLIEKQKREGADQIYFFDGEIPDHAEIFSTYNNFLAYFRRAGASKRRYIYLDEFHKVPHINKVLKIIHDHHEEIASRYCLPSISKR